MEDNRQMEQLFHQIRALKLWPQYIYDKLKTEDTLKLIKKISEKTERRISEVIAFIPPCIRYLLKRNDAYNYIEKNDLFDNFLKENYDSIVEIILQKGIQTNLPERCLVILEVLGKMLPNAPTAIIELGASYGLIGRGLLHSDRLIEYKDNYLHPEQKLPEYRAKVEAYLGIDIEIPERNWLLACTPGKDEHVQLMENFLNDIQPSHGFEMLKSSCIGFSKLNEVKEFATKHSKIVVLTSHLLYQLSAEKRKELVDEIRAFTSSVNGHWINIELNFSPLECFLEWDEEKIIKLSMDIRSSDWEWEKQHQ